MMLESNVWGEKSFLFIHTTWIGNDLLKIRKMNSAELILKTAYLSAIALAAILKTRSATRLARCLLPAFLCAHIFIKRETSGYKAAATEGPKPGGELMWATRSAPPVILCLLRAWYNRRFSLFVCRYIRSFPCPVRTPGTGYVESCLQILLEH